jgi:hypothetical protein
MTAGVHWSPARSAACTCWQKHDRVGRERVLIGAGGWDRAQTGGNGRRLEARTRGTGHGFFARPRMRAHTRCARIGRKARGLQVRTRGTGRGLFACPRLWAHTCRVQIQVNGRRRVGPGANTMSSRGWKAIRVQPLRWGHVFGRGQVRERARARTGACCRGGGCTRERGV